MSSRPLKFRRLDPWRGLPGGDHPAPLSADSAQSAQIARPTVLYVEDNPQNWELSYSWLRRRFDLLRAEDAREACRLICEFHNRLHAILMDIELRNSALDGIQLTRLVRGTLPPHETPAFAASVPVLHTPVFFLTAYVARYREAELIQEGGTNLFSKPVDFAALELALTRLRVEAELGLAARWVRATATRGELPKALLEHSRDDPRLVTAAERVLMSGRVGAVPAGVRVEKAVDTLDGEELQVLAVLVAIIYLLPESHPVLVWENVLRRGAAAVLLGAHLRLAIIPEKLLVLGMLLEVGTLAVAADSLSEATETLGLPAQLRPGYEVATAGLSHANRGAEIVRAWGLGDEWAMAVAGHHAPEAVGNFGPLAVLTCLAELVAAAFEPGHPSESFRAAATLADQHGVDASTLSRVLEQLPSEVETLAAAFCAPGITPEPWQQVKTASDVRVEALSHACAHLGRTLTEVGRERVVVAQRLSDANQRLLREASHDPLTGLGNRRLLESALNRDLARALRDGEEMAVLLADIDHFKNVNDTYGHQVGDDILRLVAAAVLSTVRRGDLCARYGGEEIAVLMPATTLEQAQEVAERLRAAVARAKHYPTHGTEIAVTISVGVAAKAAAASVTAEVLLRCADQNLYVAKQEGRNRVIASHAQ